MKEMRKEMKCNRFENLSNVFLHENLQFDTIFECFVITWENQSGEFIWTEFFSWNEFMTFVQENLKL